MPASLPPTRARAHLRVIIPTVKVLVTGSNGHLGEALMRRLPQEGHTTLGLDVTPGRFVDVAASVADREAVRAALDGVDAVMHTATLHKPHVGTHRVRTSSTPTSRGR
jgi:nucleoside-diphosphate-sugar epimerase